MMLLLPVLYLFSIVFVIFECAARESKEAFVPKHRETAQKCEKNNFLRNERIAVLGIYFRVTLAAISMFGSKCCDLLKTN